MFALDRLAHVAKRIRQFEILASLELRGGNPHEFRAPAGTQSSLQPERKTTPAWRNEFKIDVESKHDIVGKLKRLIGNLGILFARARARLTTTN